MARPRKLRLFMRTAAMVLVTAVAALGSVSTAQAAAAAERPGKPDPGVGIQVGPYSNWPGPGWFWHSAWYSVNDCNLYGYVLVAYNYATGSVCRPRWDLSGYDLWLRN